jgi:hypothetical protein
VLRLASLPLSLALWTALIASCSLFAKPDNFGGVQVDNRTDVSIDVFYAAPNASERPVAHDVAPHPATNFELFSGGGCDAKAPLSREAQMEPRSPASMAPSVNR